VSDVTIAVIGALATLAVNAAAAAFAGLRWWQVRPSDAVWPLLRAGQVLAALQALLAGVLFVAGFVPRDGLYWLYALLPVAIGVIAEQLRIASAEQVLEQRELADAQAVGALPESEQRSVVLAVVRREIGVMALAALVVALLALRAALIA
jgi:cadmium resistance protein CadD (predicted permease)